MSDQSRLSQSDSDYRRQSLIDRALAAMACAVSGFWIRGVVADAGSSSDDASTQYLQPRGALMSEQTALMGARWRAEQAEDAARDFAEALGALMAYLRRPHEKLGEACGADACVLCLSEATVRDALALHPAYWGTR